MSKLLASMSIAVCAFGMVAVFAQNKPAPAVAAPEPHASEVREQVKEPLTLSGGEGVITGTAVFNSFDPKKGTLPPLGTGKGPRNDHKRVSFGKKFSAPPKVMASISGMESSAESPSM